MMPASNWGRSHSPSTQTLPSAVGVELPYTHSYSPSQQPASPSPPQQQHLPTHPPPVHSWEPTAAPSPISLEPGRDDDVALFQDSRTGLSHLLPGRPYLGIARPNDPPCDATIHLQDAPITLRYKLEAPSLAAPSSAELSRLTANRYASWRAHQTISSEITDPSWLLSWGAEGASVATYDVALVGAPQREDLFVLVRQRMVYIITWTYPTGFPDDPAYAAFASVAEATMIWDPIRWEQRGRVWPESTFVGPGITSGRKRCSFTAASA